MLNATISLLDVIANHAPHERIRHALFLTYNFDGAALERPENGLLETIFQRGCTNAVVIRDRKPPISEKRSHRYTALNAVFTRNAFHPKLLLLLSDSAATAVVGSANLTVGGLEKNLELACLYSLTADGGPKSLFDSLKNYLSDHVRREIPDGKPERRGGYDKIVADLGTFISGVRLTGPTRYAPLLLHNYVVPLFDQIAGALKGRKTNEVWVVSPFFEPDSGEQFDDPEDEQADRHLVGRFFKTISPGEVRFYFDASASGKTGLPLNLLQPYRSKVSLYPKIPAGADQRRLHAKLLLFQGRHTNGKPFCALVHGSANFTRAALMSRAGQGNSELVVMTEIEDNGTAGRRLEEYLNLRELFNRTTNWDSFKSVPPTVTPKVPGLRVLEALLSPKNNTLEVHLIVNDVQGTKVRVTLAFDAPARWVEVGVSDPPPPGLTGWLDFKLPPGIMTPLNNTGVESEIPFNKVVVELLGGNGQTICTAEGPLNVDRPEDFVRLQYVPEDTRLEMRIYREGLNVLDDSDYERQKARLEILRGGGSVSRAVTYQATLDDFFHRTHFGFQGLQRRLRHKNASKYEMVNALRSLGDLGSGIGETDHGLTREKKLFICDLIVQTAHDGLKVMRKRKLLHKDVREEISAAFVGPLNVMTAFLQGLEGDRDLSVATRDIQKRLLSLRAKFR